MFERDIPDKELERLSKAITEAILSSKNVKHIIKEIREKELILPNTLMVMVFKIESLTNIPGSPDNEDINALKRLLNKKDKKINRQLIDGRELNPNEIAFQEYLAKKFNDEDWLKKHGLIL